MILFSSTPTSATVILSLALHTTAHAMPIPALVSPVPPVTAVAIQADGTSVVLNVNLGADGLHLVDPTGTGKFFVVAEVTKNSDPAHKANSSENVTLSLPGITWAGMRAPGNPCLLSVKSTAGFGACTVVSQLASPLPRARGRTPKELDWRFRPATILILCRFVFLLQCTRPSSFKASSSAIAHLVSDSFIALAYSSSSSNASPTILFLVRLNPLSRL
ncbi:hypothetical protein B0H14DRAFT_3448101 [Mycena olivaceomarginata]|nr:hypothetical protein B0H14DRAFT_3448101 [Mycena olivaceomarginata]